MGPNKLVLLYVFWCFLVFCHSTEKINIGIFGDLVRGKLLVSENFPLLHSAQHHLDRCLIYSLFLVFLCCLGNFFQVFSSSSSHCLVLCYSWLMNLLLWAFKAQKPSYPTLPFVLLIFESLLSFLDMLFTYSVFINLYTYRLCWWIRATTLVPCFLMCHMRYAERLKVLFMYLFIVFYKTPTGTTDLTLV